MIDLTVPAYAGSVPTTNPATKWIVAGLSFAFLQSSVQDEGKE